MLGICPYIIPPSWWDVLWLTRPAPLVGFAADPRLTRRAQSCADPGLARDRNKKINAEPMTVGLAGVLRPRKRGTAAMNAQELLQEISDYCRQTGLAESTFGRRAVNDGKLASRLRNGGRITTETLDRIRAFMATQPQCRRAPDRDRARAGARPCADPGPAAGHAADAGRAARWPRAQRAARSAAQLPLLRQPAEVSAVRQHLQRKVGGGEPRRARTRQHPSAPAGAARVRRRRRRRHRAAARDARDARPLSAHAVLRRRQGDQPRGRPPRHAEDVGPLLRASGDRAGADQPRLRRRAVAGGEIAQRRPPAWSGTRCR